MQISLKMHILLSSCLWTTSVLWTKLKKRPPFSVLKLNAAQVIRNIEMKLAVSQTLICTTADNILLLWEKKVIMIRKLSISRSTYLLKRRVSFPLFTTGYTSHFFFFTTECCDFGDKQPCIRSRKCSIVVLKSSMFLTITHMTVWD